MNRVRLSWKIWLPVSVLAVAVIGLWGAWHATGMAEASSAFDRQKARARELGMPASLAEIRHRTAANPATNAALVYIPHLASFEPRRSLPAKEVATLIDKERQYGLTDEEWRLVGKQLKALAKPLAQIEKGSRLPDFDMRRRWELGYALPFPEYQTFRTLGKVLAMRAVLRSREGDPTGALDDVETALGLAQQLRKEPTLMAMLTSMAVEHIALEQIERVCNLASADANLLQRALRIVQAQKLPDLHGPASTEFLSLESAMRDLARDPNAFGTISSEAHANALRLASVRRAVMAVAMRAPLEIYERYPRDPDDYKAAAKVLREADRKLEADTSMPAQIARTFAMTYSDLSGSLMRLMARRRVQEAAIKLLIERQKGHQIPATLTFETLDPFTDRPLVYRPSESGFIVYSVGSDKGDDFGLSAAGKTEADDIAWWFGKQPPKRARPKPTALIGR